MPKADADVDGGSMTDEQFRALLDLVMVLDPWPLDEEGQIVIKDLLYNEAVERGYETWEQAYHEH